MTNSINLAALGFGGIDTSTLVSGLVAAEEAPYNQANAEQQNVQSAQTTISSFASDMSALSSAATTLSDPTSFSSMTATSSDPSVVATVNSIPPPGQWSVSVSAVAQDQRTLSAGAASSTSALGLSGTLNISVGSASPTAVQVSSTDSLTSIASEINSAGLQVQASVVYDGSQYHLMVAGLDTGSANAVTFDESGLTSSGYTLGLSDPASTIQAAQNAQLTVGGIAISSASNQINNAIPGVTLAITQPTTSPATVSIESDPTTITQNVQAFVTAYNAVVSAGHTDAGYGSTAATNPLLQGDSAIRSSLSQLGQLMSEGVPGATGSYTTLDSVGLSLNTDGTLTLNTSELSAALAADPTSVASLFVTDPSTGSQGVMGALTTTINNLATGSDSALQAEISGFQSRSQELTTEMAAMQQQTAAYQTQLQNEFTQMNASLAQYKQISASLNSMDDTSSSSSSTNTVL